MEAVGFLFLAGRRKSSGWQTRLAWSTSFETASVRPQNTKRAEYDRRFARLTHPSLLSVTGAATRKPPPTIATSTTLVATRGRHVWKTASD